MNYILPLSQTRLDDSDRVGRKSAVLADLVAAGSVVPDGFSVTTDALDACLAAAPPGSEEPAQVRAHIMAMALPESFVAEVAAALAGLGDDPVAVRSSGVAEDLAGQSFAGQYESVLNVRGLDGVLEAVRTCWASGFSERIAVYRGDGHVSAEVGVLVQRMVAADAAGVAFSCNPVTGDSDEVLISAVVGLGERLMAGEQTADEWLVRDGKAEITAAAAPGEPAAIDAAQALEVAELAVRTAEHYGKPQDIEWAYAGGELFLLQARPITTLSAVVREQIEIPIEEPEQFSTRDRNAVRPWTRLQTSLFLPVFSDAARHVFRFTTGATPQASSIGGWVYMSLPQAEPGTQLARIEDIAVQIRDGAPRKLVDRWNTEWKPAFAARLAALREIDPVEIDDATLLAHIRDMTGFFAEVHDVYFRLTGAAVVLLGELGVAAQEVLGWSAAQTLQLRGGLVGDHMQIAIGLGELARLAAARPDVRAIIEQGAPDAVEQLGRTDPEFAQALLDYREAYCHRTIGFDLTEPTLAEQPAVLLNLIRAQLDEPFDADRERAALRARLDATLAEAEPGLAAAGPQARQRFEAALAGSDLGAPVRDEKVYYAVSLWALLRYSLLELGGRLTAAGLTEHAHDVLHLDLETALEALPARADLREQVRTGRGQHTWAAAHPGPAFYGPPPTPLEMGPDLPEPSAGAEYVAQLAQWSMSLWAGGPGGESPAGTLRGLAASAGRYTGPARVIRDVTEFGKLRRGDVLVCPETTAQWAVLFPSVGALVTDNGSILSHPAIISREYGVPAVLATGSATSTFRDGQVITVDGAAGVVTLAGEL
ncbi:PEP/pyruvate-binding domain-containing protein [Actinoplanes sp. TFC3]|uniref:PEP/pyruvate-binding domain-containing protein n=1 Tax=Actinoplanes sp. TFC3 TaxID=1710355 RepID=UPI000835EDC0|nr:PEP/pyruvate-binding domain-containing protein [Actinoplanes sp. TFC3]